MVTSRGRGDPVKDLLRHLVGGSLHRLPMDLRLPPLVVGRHEFIHSMFTDDREEIRVTVATAIMRANQHRYEQVDVA